MKMLFLQNPYNSIYLINTTNMVSNNRSVPIHQGWTTVILPGIYKIHVHAYLILRKWTYWYQGHI